MLSALSPSLSLRKPAAPKFAGVAEREAYRNQLKQFPQDSIERLAAIKRAEKEEAPKHVEHVRMAIVYGKLDKNIKWVNDQIQTLLKQRNANKQSNLEVSETAREHLGDLRKAMDLTLADHQFDADGNPFKAVEKRV